ncbi:MAG: hypothetical protein EOP09_15210 [Proteobacteria bacterium]|nr:MAG: hypothetical protein EOP09_15210 [Pseudomonadota bacterium]
MRYDNSDVRRDPLFICVQDFFYVCIGHLSDRGFCQPRRFSGQGFCKDLSRPTRWD